MRAKEFILETVTVEMLHGLDFRSSLREERNLIENHNEFQQINDFLNSYKQSPVVGNYYVYTSLITTPYMNTIQLANFSKPRRLVKINGKFAHFETENGIKRFPEDDEEIGDVFQTILYFNSMMDFNKFETALRLKTNFKITQKVFESNSMFEGGWASQATQSTVINPQSISDLMPALKDFETALNRELAKDGIPPIKIGNPVGSGTYYQQDLDDNPEKEYGDIDVQFIVPRVEGMTAAQIRTAYVNGITEFCRLNGNYETDTGINVIFHNTPIGPVQIDMVIMFGDRVEWTAALAPERGTKGVLSSSLYSALAQVLNISISDDGILPKKGRLKDYDNPISFNPKQWGLELAKHLGAKRISPRLKAVPGMIGQVRIADIINTIKGIAETLELNGKGNAEELLSNIKDIYLQKINKVITSSKFDKAESPEAQKKAKETKEMLAKRSQEIVSLF